jgi:hypothetical protein
MSAEDAALFKPESGSDGWLRNKEITCKDTYSQQR